MILILQKIKNILSVKKHLAILIGIFALFFGFIFYVSAPPSNFNKNYILNIEKGETIRQVAIDLKENNIIKSQIFFSVLLEVSRSHVVTGRYIFK